MIKKEKENRANKWVETERAIGVGGSGGAPCGASGGTGGGSSFGRVSPHNIKDDIREDEQLREEVRIAHG